MDPALRRVIAALEQTGWAAVVADGQWTLVWVSDEAKALMGETDPEQLGIGAHLLTTWQREPWRGSATTEARDRWLETNVPYMLHTEPEGKDGLRAVAGEDRAVLRHIGRMEPSAPPPLWTSTLEFVQGDLPPVRASYVAVRHEVDGKIVGTSYVFGPHLPASLLALVARGNEGMFRRMATLFDPAQRPAAVLFADLRSSSDLSRRLPSAAYFQLVREILSAIDAVVIEHGGIVGKHVGDGATAFFLSEHLGSDSAAARAAIDTAVKLPDAACDAAERVTAAGASLDRDEVQLGIGAHWGAGLYIGQIVTGGRLEVTALGDAVNEAARVEQSAHGGEVLVTKELVERVDDADAEALGLVRDELRYRPLAEIAQGADKAVRDAGALAVTDLGAVFADQR